MRISSSKFEPRLSPILTEWKTELNNPYARICSLVNKICGILNLINNCDVHQILKWQIEDAVILRNGIHWRDNELCRPPKGPTTHKRGNGILSAVWGEGQ